MTERSDFFGPDVDLARMNRDRKDKVGAAMRQSGVDALVLVDPLNIEYVTGAPVSHRDGSAAKVALVTADQAVHTFDAPPDVKLASPMMPEYMLETWEGTAREIADVVGPANGGRVAIDRANTNMRWLQQVLGHPKRWVDESGAEVVMAARATKTPDEAECLRRSNRAMGYALDRVREALQPGSTMADLGEVGRRAFAELDPVGDVLTMGGTPAAKAQSAGMMWIATESDARTAAGGTVVSISSVARRPFQAGDAVWPDSGLGYRGMESDYGRTWIVGGAAPTSQHRDLFKRWLEVRDAVVQVLRPGRTIADMVAAAKRVGGDKPWLQHLFLAHGTGLVTEYPFAGVERNGFLVRSLAAPSQWRGFPREEEIVLQAGMAFVLEPVIWDDKLGYRSEDTYLITESEPELLSKWSYAPFD